MSKLIVDFRHSNAAQKRDFLQQHADMKVVMDFSTLDPTAFYAEFPQLVGSFPGQFAVNGKCELHLCEEVAGADDALQAHGLTAVRTTIAGLGFTVPRTLAMIINEAYFAFEQEVATRADIDRAMRFGVNYPQGPFEWVQGRESLYIELLENLQAATGDARYSVSSSLAEGRLS